MNICLVSVAHPIAQALEHSGHAVLHLMPKAGRVLDLAAALHERSFDPDLILQQEVLADRILLSNLDAFPCPKLFWAIDPHLNAFWQAAYARLFDVVLSTQKRWLPELRARGAAQAEWLPWFGRQLDWIPFGKRTHDIGFVGRLTGQRPARQWFVEFLAQRFPGRVFLARDLKYADMIEAYRQTRLAPNESIFGEVNFRLFEAASAGCLVLNQDLHEELDGLFSPGLEIEVFGEVVELGERLGHLLADQHRAQATARAGYERIAASHLPGHRAARILEIAQAAGRNAATGPEAEAWLWLAAFALWEAGRMPLDPGRLARALPALPPTPQALSALVRFQVGSNRQEEAAQTLTAILAGNLHPASLELDLAGSVAALGLGLRDQARQFWLRWLKHGTGPRAPAETPADGKHLLRLWAHELRRAGIVLRPGFPFDERLHLPATAVECLLSVLKDEPEELAVLRELDAMLVNFRGVEQSRVGLLSVLTLHERRDWRLGLEIGLCDLRSFRREAGLEELRVALSLAESQNQAKAFLRVLKARDPRGYVWAALRGAG